MHVCRVLFTIIFFFISARSAAQDNREYRTFRFTSPHTSFPDSGRLKGYTYDSVFYTASAHYMDSSVLLYVPDNLDKNRPVNLVFWFHGWHNNIDTAAVFYGLFRQFIAAKKNAILVLAETGKNVPDSYGGRLEQEGMFKALVQDIMNALKKQGVVPDRAITGNIILAGHSGAFRVIAYILQNGEMQVQEVFLFDALYSQVDKFLNWIYLDPSHHFIHWYTNQGGGTDEMSVMMMRQLKEHHTAYLLTEETEVKPEIIKKNRILFVHSLREHNVIINNPDDFQLLLENSFILQ